MGKFDQVRCNFPTLDSEPTVNEEEKKIAERNHAILSGDAGMSWGGGGATQTTHERGAEQIPPGAAQALGISPENVSTASQPDANHNRSHNMTDIANYPIG